MKKSRALLEGIIPWRRVKGTVSGSFHGREQRRRLAQLIHLVYTHTYIVKITHPFLLMENYTLFSFVKVLSKGFASLFYQRSFFIIYSLRECVKRQRRARLLSRCKTLFPRSRWCSPRYNHKHRWKILFTQQPGLHLWFLKITLVFFNEQQLLQHEPRELPASRSWTAGWSCRFRQRVCCFSLFFTVAY